MPKTIAFVTNQHQCDRLIHAAYKVAIDTQSELLVVGVLDSEYELDPQAVDYLFMESKKYNSSMRLLFTDDKTERMREVIERCDCEYLVTGMPHSHNSVQYELWREFPNKSLYTVDNCGEITEVATKRVQVSGFQSLR